MTTDRLDPVVEAGRLWLRHAERCEWCTPATPGCRLGEVMRAVYLCAVESEEKRA